MGLLLDWVKPETSGKETHHVLQPRDVLWDNLAIGYKEKGFREWLISVATGTLVFFYIIPIAFVQGLTSLTELEAQLPAFAKVVDSNPAVKGFLMGFLPSLILMIFVALLPHILACKKIPSFCC